MANREELVVNELLTPAGTRIAFSTAVPTAGTYKVGDLIINTAPAGDTDFAWRCSVAGAPGTWVAIAAATNTQAAPAAKTATAAITAAELAGKLITTTGVTAPSVHQLPTGTLLEAEFPGIAVGDSFDFTLINTGTGAADDATITVNTDVTIVGNPTVGALTDATILSGSGTFRARKSAANAFVVYRIA